MKNAKSIIACMVLVAVMGLGSAAHAVPLQGTYTIEAGSQFFMAGVGGTSFLGGTDQGFFTGLYQSDPAPTTPAGDNTGASSIVNPQSFIFFGFPVYVSTNMTDPATGTITYPAPSVDNSNGTLTGDLKAWDATWNGTHFNQGAPKDNSAVGFPNNVAPTGTYDSGSMAYTMSWVSQIVGGPFNGFTGEWTLVGSYSGGECDADGIPDQEDNCLCVPNFYQEDLDGDGIGDACDCDDDGDGYDDDTTECAGMDCNDLDPEINPGAMDYCYNGIDENCDRSDATACSSIKGLFTVDRVCRFTMAGVGSATCQPGTQRGLITEQYQPDPPPTTPVNDYTGSDAIIDCDASQFFGFSFCLSTNQVDPVDGVTPHAIPRVFDNGDGTIQANLAAMDVLWNGTHFNQGSPKDMPGTMADAPVPIGTYDPITNAYSLSWSSIIIGGPFDGFTGEWQFAGHVEPIISDCDSDGIPDNQDNCECISNPLQEDCDVDGIGDACDDDVDGDGWTLAMGDCDDSCGGRDIHPAVAEIPCDGIDQNCDGSDDCPDCDQDGIPDSQDSCECIPNPTQEDCDADGIGDVCDDDLDGDGYTRTAGDCNDTCGGAGIHPGATEIPCNGVDEDCSGADDCVGSCVPPDHDIDNDTVCSNIDNCPDVPNPDQADCDGDGLGDACDEDLDGDGYARTAGDCDDTCTGKRIHPGAADIECNGIDEDCSGQDNCAPDCDKDGVPDGQDNCECMSNPAQYDCDGDGLGDVCDDDRDGDGYTMAQGDCNDNCQGRGIHPGATEIPCNKIDEDCSGADDCPVCYGQGGDADNDQVCDNTDNCLGVANPGQHDCDGDGLGDPCDEDADGDGWTVAQGDCNDTCTGININPGMEEIPLNNVDENCDGIIDLDSPRYGDVQVMIKAPKKVDNCEDRFKKIKVQIENKDFGGQQATIREVPWTLYYRGQVWETGSVILERGQRVVYKFYYLPFGEPEGHWNEWKLEATVPNDPDLSNNTDVQNTKIKAGKCKR